MGKGKKQERLPGDREELVDTTLLKLFGVVTLAYIVLWAAIGSLMGAGFAALLAMPLWGISLFVIAKWDRTRKSDGTLTLRNLVAVPALNYWNVGFVILPILVLHQVFTFVVFLYLNKARAEFMLSAPNDLAAFFDRITNDHQATILFLIATFIAHLGGGFTAAYLPNRKYPFPYRHAVVASLIYSLFAVVLMVPLMTWSGEFDFPSQQEAGLALLGAVPAFLFALLGVWLAIGTQKPTTEIKPIVEGPNSDWTRKARVASLNATSGHRNSKVARSRSKKAKKIARIKAEQVSQANDQTDDIHLSEVIAMKKKAWPRRSAFILATSIFLVGLAAVSIWVVWMPGPTVCSDPPATATLNYWPVSYSDTAEFCHDFPLIRARLVEAKGYAQNREEWERGLRVHAGNEIYALVYINNGAASNAESLNPGKGIAKNVRLTTEVSSEGNGVHFIKTLVTADNAKSVSSSFKITTDPNETLELVPTSGEIFNYQAALMKDGLEIGNNTFALGDLEPTWEDCKFIRFKLKILQLDSGQPN